MTIFKVRPDVQALLDQLAENPRPEFSDALIAQMRANPTDVAALMDLPVGELGEIRDVVMPGPGGEMNLRLFDARATREASPVVVFVHGGGFVAGSVDNYAAVAAEIARQLDLPVISVEYRLAPEHKWPAAPDDAEAAARWIADNAAAFGRSFTHLVLCGDSAGGNLAIVTALALRDAPAALPVLAQIAIYPVADSSRAYASADHFGLGGYGLSNADMAYFHEAYAGEAEHWRTSPVLADQAGLPPTLVVTASLDPLRDQGRAYAAAAIQAGVPTIYHEFDGTIHGFCSYRKLIASGQDDLVTTCRLAKALIAEALG